MLTLCLCCFYAHHVSYIMSPDSLLLIAPPRADECLTDMCSEINDEVKVRKY